MSSTASTVLNKPTVRDSGIELLRILSAIGVVVLHYNGNFAFSLVEKWSINSYILLLLEGLFICAVNIFILISGYFLSSTPKRKTVKVLELIIQVIVMSLGLYIGASAMSSSFSFKSALVAAIPNNYFVTLYITLYLVSPYINIALNRLSDKSLISMTALFFFLFSIWPTLLDIIGLSAGHVFSGLYTTNTDGSQLGYSIINFVLMYLIGAFIRRKNITLAKHLCTIFLIICVSVLLGLQLLLPQVARSYCNPLVILVAVFAFLLFKQFTFKSRIVNRLSKASFTCFLIHTVFLSFIGIERFVNASPLYLVLHIILSATVIFLISFAVWTIYDFITRPFFGFLSHKLTRIDRVISPEEIG